MTTIERCDYATPLGPLSGASREGALVALPFSARWAAI